MLKNERTGKSGKFLCALLAAAIALTMLITPQAGAMESDAESTASGNVDYKTILGDAVNFGVTTEDFQLRGGDAQTNVAAIKGICTSQTGNEITNKEEQTFILANIDTVFKIKGQGAGAYVRTTKESRGKLEGSGEKVIIDTTSTEKQLTDEVNAMLDHAWDQSAILASHEDTAVLEPDKNDHAKYMVDLTGKHAGTYYVTITDEDLKDKFNGGDRLRIYKSIDQNIIFNVTAKGNNRSIDIWKAPINGKNPEDFYNTKDKSAEDQATAQTIVWNIVNATDVHLHPVAGIILAPKGTASTEETGSGWIVAKSVNIKGGEWHNTYQNVKKTRNDNDKAELAAKKQVNGADSQVSGFKFRLEEKTNQEWEAVGSEIENEGAAISFPTIEYDADDAGGHIYRITETKGNVDSNGNSYDADKSVYYAKVTVSKYDIIEGTEVKGAAVSASKPEYFSDEKCTKPVDLPVFNNTSKSDETSVSVTKVWDDNDNNDGFRPADIEVQLQADGKDVDGKIIKLSKENNWSGSFTKLPASKDGKAITYTVVEKNVPNKYDSSVTGDAKNGFVITNKHTKEKTSVSGTKTWNDNDNQDGKRPDSITVNLVKDGKVIDSKKVSAADDWKYSFTGLDKYENGKEIKYTVEEEAVPGYTTEVKGTDLINTHEIEKTEISGTKTWNDNDNQDGKRPDSITVKLMKDGKVIDAKNVTAEDDWKYSFTGLDKYENGQEIVYTISEVPVEGYNSETDGFDLINTHKTETVNVNGHKIWKDNNNKNDTRPESITINLLKNGEVYETETVTAKDGWKWSFTDLPKYEAGKEIKYKISENKVEDYRTTVKGYNVENTYNGGGGGNNHNHRKDRRGEDKKHGKQPKTGDELGLYTFMAITGGAIALLIGALYLRKRN